MTYNTSNALLSSLVYDKARVNQQAADARASYVLADGSRWTLRYFGSDPNGYQGGVFVNEQTNAIVVVNRGTEPTSLGDLRADLQMGIRQVPGQFAAAEETYLQAKLIAASLEVPVPISSIVITGHSLGGALTQLIAAKYAADGITAETFNAYGAGNLLSGLGISGGSFGNIVNRVIEHDVISQFPGSELIGTTFSYAAPPDSMLETAYGRQLMGLPGMYLKYGFASHSADLFGIASVQSQPGRQITEQTPRINYIITPFGLASLIASLFATANALSPNAPAAPRRDPLSFDLDGDGIETIGIDTANPILFDHTGSGVKTATGWLGADDAFLALDRNGNGSIDSGRELFGDSTLLPDGSEAVDGFAALAAEDTNADGVVDAQDAHFASLRLWKDLDQDGISDAGELQTLTEAGIASITVAKTENAVPLANGNQIADLGTYTRIDGSTGGLGETADMADVDLASNPFFSEFADHIALTAQAQALPDMQGSGLVRNLREAASLQTAAGQHLASVLTAYAAATTKAGQMALLPDLVEAWAATSTMGARTGPMGRRCGPSMARACSGVIVSNTRTTWRTPAVVRATSTAASASACVTSPIRWAMPFSVTTLTWLAAKRLASTKRALTLDVM